MKKRLFYLLALLLTMVTQEAWAEGELNGVFTINASGDKVQFSQGNLQAYFASAGTSCTWCFATNQYDYVGNAAANNAINGNGSVSAAGAVDLFGWSTNATYYGINNSSNASDYSGDFRDWGNLAISNGGNTANSGWRTLARDEWTYLFTNHTYGYATVAGVKGIIITPDNYIGPAIDSNHSDDTNPFARNTIDASTWTSTYVSAGVVFLPAAGFRIPWIGQVQENAYYWSSTPVNATNKYATLLGKPNNEAIITYSSGGNWTANDGFSVRLVKDVDFIDNGDGSYTICNARGWDVFCDLLANNTNYFNGKTVNLGNDIGTTDAPITRYAGTSGHDFNGTFDGCGHTMTVNIVSNGPYTAAPFAYAVNATIQHLHVAGTITTSSTYAGGIIGGSWPGTDYLITLIDCHVSATITSSNNGPGYMGGLIGNVWGKANIEGCTFDGKLMTTTSTRSCGGLVGYSDGAISISKSLYAPSAQSNLNVSGCATLCITSGIAPTITNCYYTATLGTAQGTASRTVTAGDAYVTTCEVNPVGDAVNTYTVSGITAYANGITRDGTFYYGNGDNVSLTLSHAAAVAGQHFVNYTVSGGGTLTNQTESTATLSMADANQTISAQYADNSTHSVTYVDGTDWSTAPSSTPREGETVTLTYSGPHKVKSVSVAPKRICTLAEVTSAHVGKVIGANGYVYGNVAAASADGTTASSIIAYVGSAGSVEASSSSYRGLAISLDNVATFIAWCGDCTVRYSGRTLSQALSEKNGWGRTSSYGNADSRNYTADGHTHNHAAAAAAYDYSVSRPVGTSRWFVPTMGQWNLAVQGLTGSTTDISETQNPEYSYYNLKTKFDAAGVNPLTWCVYWSSTEKDGTNMWTFCIEGNGSEALAVSKSLNAAEFVRAFFAF